MPASTATARAAGAPRATSPAAPRAALPAGPLGQASAAALAAAVPLAVVLLAAGCAPRATDYATLAEARAAGVFGERLLPDVLPPSAALIRVERDGDAPAGFFHFASADYAPLAAQLAPLPQLPADPALKTWVLRKDLAGYDAFTVQRDGAHWLLLCAQNKGRCFVRRI